MKLHIIISLLFIFAPLSFGQKLSASPTPTPAASTEKSKVFGSSLEKYKNKVPQNAQNKPKSDVSDDSETIQVKTNLVVNDISVTDQTGKVITDLKKDEFIVTENGTPQTVDIFSTGENLTFPRSIVLIISNDDLEFPYLKNSVAAAKLLVEKLNPNDKMAIVTSDVKLRTNFTQDKTLLKKTLDLIGKQVAERKFGGGGLEFETLLAVINEMFAKEDQHPIIIFQGNAIEMVRIKTGNETLWRFYSSYTPYLKTHEKYLRYLEFRDIEETVEKSRATIYSVVTGFRFLEVSKKEQLERGRKSLEYVSESVRARTASTSRMITETRREFEEMEVKRHIAEQTAMLKIAELSGGNLSFIEKPEDAENVYSSIFNQISSRYAIGYYPTNEARDGKRREVKIMVRNHPEYIITGRKSYFSQ